MAKYKFYVGDAYYKRVRGDNMPKTKQRAKGETYRPVVKVLKVKKGVPTKVRFSGFEYALVHPDHKNGKY